MKFETDFGPKLVKAIIETSGNHPDSDTLVKHAVLMFSGPQPSEEQLALMGSTTDPIFTMRPFFESLSNQTYCGRIALNESIARVVPGSGELSIAFGRTINTRLLLETMVPSWFVLVFLNSRYLPLDSAEYPELDATLPLAFSGTIGLIGSGCDLEVPKFGNSMEPIVLAPINVKIEQGVIA